MKIPLLICITILLAFTNCQAKVKPNLEMAKENSSENYIELSAEFLESIINDKPSKEIQNKLETVSIKTLSSQLTTDIKKKVFWINIYNAYIQLLLTEHPELYEDRGEFFKKNRITIAGEALSFDKIEHGIIRSSKIKLSLGLLRNPFAGKYERTFRMKNTDPRIHFALNCGAKSCPLVAVYRVENFDSKIDAVAADFLIKTTSFNQEKNTVAATSLFSWFRGDFGGKQGIIQFLQQYDQIPTSSTPDLNFTTYEWTLSLNNYYNE